MRLLVHVGRVLRESVHYGFATRRASLIVIVVLGLILLALTLAAQTVAPLALYPFA